MSLDPGERARILARKFGVRIASAILNVDAADIVAFGLNPATAPVVRSVPTAIYTASLLNVDAGASSDTPVAWEAAPTFSPEVFALGDGQEILIRRQGVYSIRFFAEPLANVPEEDIWNFRFPANDTRDEVSWTWTTQDYLGGDGTKRGYRLHAEWVASVEDEMALPVVLDPNASADMSFDLTAFPQRLGDFALGSRSFLP